MEHILVNPEKETVKTNILNIIINERNLQEKGTTLEEVKEIIQKLENTNFDLKEELLTFEGIKFGIYNDNIL